MATIRCGAMMLRASKLGQSYAFFTCQRLNNPLCMSSVIRLQSTATKQNVSNDVFKQEDSKEFKEDVKKNLENMRKGQFSSVKNPEDLAHFNQSWQKETGRLGETVVGSKPDEPEIGSNALPHPIWKQEQLHNVKITHQKPEAFVDKLALFAVKLLRGSFDILSGFNKEPRSEHTWINRLIFLETVAGVPGMVAAMVRHLHSLRRMRRDHGWIHTMLEEAENERMHLMTALCLKNPGFMFRYSVVGVQGIFVTFFSVAYLISPRFCHRFVGYLEEEAVMTYSKLLKDMDGGSMKHWNTFPAPPLAINYWKLPTEATMYDVILVIRADEAHHRLVNHTLGSMKSDDYNPYKPGQ